MIYWKIDLIHLTEGYFTDTPGFENENLTKPEETKIISGGAGLAKPEDIAMNILNDSLVITVIFILCSHLYMKVNHFYFQSGNFISISGFESWLITIICSGMSPWGGFFFTLLQSIILGPLRFVAYGTQWYCQNVVKNCAQKRSSTPIETKKDE